MLKIFTSDLRRNITKILCLTIGLAIGMILVASVYFVQSYDTFFKDSDRIYQLTESAEFNGEYKEFNQVPGAIAPGFKRYIPYVESATRITPIKGSARAYLDDNRVFWIEGVCLADSCLFDVLEWDIIEGDVHSVLATKDYCMIPKSLADKIGGNVIGRQIRVPELSPDYNATIGGVYEDFPDNSVMINYVYLSLKSISQFMGDGSDNWQGNDRYIGYVKLIKGAKPEDLRPGIDRLVKENLTEDAIKIAHLNFGVKPLVGAYTSQDGIKNMTWVMSLLAVIILLCAGVNYLLIVVGQISSRSKEMAIRKCYGTSDVSLFGRVIFESIFYLVVSMILAILLLFSFHNLVRELIGVSVSTLLSTGYVWWVETLVLSVLFIITGILPAYIYCRTPVANAFRNNINSRKFWKISLLCVEFCATGFLICLLSVVARQYRMLSDIDMGFNIENIGLLDLSGVPVNVKKPLIEELKKIGNVEGVGTSDSNFIEFASGDNIWTEGRRENPVNIADMYYTNPDVFGVLGVEFKQGRNFSVDADSTINEVIVEERFVDILNNVFNIKGDDIIGQSFYCTGHDGMLLYTIVGVVENMRRGSFEKEGADTRAAVFFPTIRPRWCTYVRFTKLTPEALSAAQKVINEFITDREVYITPYKNELDYRTENIRKFGKCVIVVSIAILLIALLGLMGYVTDEVQRRSKEIAIRKVVGTGEGKILKLFCADMIKVALPSLIVGALAAYIAAWRWLEQFTEKVSVSPAIFLLCIIALLILVIVVVVLNSLSVSRSNPVNYLRSE